MTFYQISLVRQTSQFVVQQLRDGYRSVPDLSDKLQFVVCATPIARFRTCPTNFSLSFARRLSLGSGPTNFSLSFLRDAYRSVPDLSDKLKFVGQQLTEGLMPSRKPQVAVSAQRA